MIYITKIGEGFGFKDTNKDEILSTDVKMLNEVYNKFFEMQSLGNQYTLGDINGESFEKMFVEVIEDVAPPVIVPPTQLSELQNTMDAIIMSLLQEG